MSIKLALLKSGEDVIADIKEIVSEETNKRAAYVFSDPYVVKLTHPQVLVEDTEQPEKRAYNISVYPWMPLTEDTDIVINPDWVVTIVEPANKLKLSYEQRNGRTEESDSSRNLNESLELDNGN